MRIFTYTGPYNDDLLSDIIKTYTNIRGVNIEAVLEDTNNPTLRKMIITVDAPENDGMFELFNKHNKSEVYGGDGSPLNDGATIPKPNKNLGA